ncbi:MAG TPA: ATP-binding protein [Ktedonobacterales bacterium]|jgi:two-component system phosphate regulon sensor histidine kinase PhoR
MLLDVLLGALAGILVASFSWLLLIRRAFGERDGAREAQQRAQRRQSQIETEMLALERLFSGMLDAVPRPVFVVNRDRVILQANQAATELAHLPHHRVVGRVVATVIQDHETTMMLMESAKTGKGQERIVHNTALGETWRIVITPLRLSSVGGIFAEQETRYGPPALLRQAVPDGLPSHLVLTIEDLTRLQQLETVRRDFVANVSHELRTPLASVKLLAETLQDILDRDPEAARTFAQRIEVEIDALTRMVNELLELSRIESGHLPLRLEPTDIRELIKKSAARVENLAALQGVKLQLAWDSQPEPPAATLPLALADGERIEQVLLNLLHNALKFTPESGTITLAADPTEGEQSLTVWVRDTGIGISEEDLPRIFERFYKVDRARTRGNAGPLPGTPGGTGLGLAIARHLVEGHGGRIWAESKPGRGSTFRFTLPIATEPTASSHVGDTFPEQHIEQQQQNKATLRAHTL